MSEEKKEKPEVPTQTIPGQPQVRKIIIETDGNKWNIAQGTSCSALEIKEICREVILRLGS